MRDTYWLSRSERDESGRTVRRERVVRLTAKQERALADWQPLTLKDYFGLPARACDALLVRGRHALPFITALALALTLAACSDSEPVIPADDLALSIVSGDGIEDTVHIDPAAANASAARLASLSPGVPVYGVGELEVSPVPMVVEFGADVATASASITAPGGVSLDVLPSGTTADWVIVDRDGQPVTDGSCGRPVNVTTIPDPDTHETANNWQRPLKSGTCYMRVQGMVGSESVVDTVFTRTFLPGPPAGGPNFHASANRETTHDSLGYVTGFTGDIATFGAVYDANGNFGVYAYRVEAAGSWIQTVGGAFGTDSARAVRVDTLAASYGDTATVRFYGAGDVLLCDCLATLAETVVGDSRNGFSGRTWLVSASAREP